MRILPIQLVVLLFIPTLLPAQGFIAAGRGNQDGFSFELYGGYGGMDSVEGSFQETRDGQAVSAGVSVDLKELGLEDDFSTVMLGGRAYNRWVTFLVDYRSSSLEASGTAQREYRLAVDDVLFGGQRYGYLIIPQDAHYDIDATATWLGLGVRVTPLTFNPDGYLTFTPWLHLGIQAISADYEVDAGGSVSVQTSNNPTRTYVRQGHAEGTEEAAIPEYGIGGEVRLLLHEPGQRGLEVIAEATYKILDFQGAIDALGIDKDEFEDIDLTYTALEANLYVLIPLKKIDLMAGLYVEQVEVDALLEAENGRTDTYDRDIEASYTLYGARIGVRF